MNYLDLILLIVIFLFCWIGFKKGFFSLFFQLIKWTGALLLAFFLCRDIVPIINTNFIIQDQWQLPISFTLVFLFAFHLLSLSIFLVKKVLKPAIHQNVINRFAGIIPGILFGLLTAIFIVKVSAASLWQEVTTEVRQGAIAKPLNNSASWVTNKITNDFNLQAQQKISGAFEVGPGVNLSEEFKSNNFSLRPDLGKQLLQLVNNERSAIGLKKVNEDAFLQNAARRHAEDMFKRGYFSHETPEGTDPFERMKQLNIRFKAAGENLAHSNSLLSAHNGLMNSPGHRANILNAHFSRLGIAILDGGNKGLMIVEEFRD